MSYQLINDAVNNKDQVLLNRQKAVGGNSSSTPVDRICHCAPSNRESRNREQSCTPGPRSRASSQGDVLPHGGGGRGVLFGTWMGSLALWGFAVNNLEHGSGYHSQDKPQDVLASGCAPSFMAL